MGVRGMLLALTLLFLACALASLLASGTISPHDDPLRVMLWTVMVLIGHDSVGIFGHGLDIRIPHMTLSVCCLLLGYVCGVAWLRLSRSRPQRGFPIEDTD